MNHEDIMGKNIRCEETARAAQGILSLSSVHIPPIPRVRGKWTQTFPEWAVGKRKKRVGYVLGQESLWQWSHVAALNLTWAWAWAPGGLNT